MTSANLITPKTCLIATVLLLAAITLPLRNALLSQTPVQAQGVPLCVAPPSDLKLWLPFDETTGALANDLAGFNNLGLYGAGAAKPTPGPGKVVGALAFDGADDYAEVTHATDIDFLGNCVNDVAESFTIDAWVRTAVSTGLQTILDKRVNAANPRGYHLFIFDGRLGFQIATGTTFSNFVAPGNPVADGNWHFIAVTVTRCRGAAGRLYVDGNLALSFAPLIGNLSNPANLNIGRRIPAFGANYLRGALDELEIFKRALSAAELQAIFNAGSAGKCKPACGPQSCKQPVFEPPVYYSPSALNPVNFSFGDFDGDGIPDLVTINRNSNAASVLLGKADGTFITPPKTIITTGTTPQAAAAGDFNQDGKLDLAVVIQSPANAVILIGNGDGTFQLTVSSFSVGGSPSSVVALDFNADGNLDLTVANNLGVRLLAGAGNGTFTTGALLTALSNPQFVTAGDFNQDGRPDLVAANLSANQISLFLANTSGGFNAAQNLTVASGSNNIAVGDLDLDGDLDLAVSCAFANTASILLGNGTGGFAAAINQNNLGNPPNAVAIGEFDGDGLPDLVVANSASAALVILKGNGNGMFSAGTSVSLTGTSTQIVVGDFNQDGKSDIAANVPAGNQVAILLNNCPVNNPALLTIAPTTLANGTVGSAYSQMFTASGGTAAYTFAVTAGALPGGLTLAANGLLTGTTTQTGMFTFTVMVTDANGCTTSQEYKLTIDCPRLTISPATLANGTAGANYGPVNLTASGGTAPYTFAVTSGTLPTMLTLSASGQLTGVLMQTGSFTFTVTVTDKFGCTGVRVYTLTVDCGTITILPAAPMLPAATVNTAYNPPQTFTASGGCGQFVFGVSGGALPTGLSVNPNTGALTGTPTQAGAFNFTIKVTDKCGCMATKNYSLEVRCPVVSLLNRQFFNTGVDNNGQPLPTYAQDPHYPMTPTFGSYVGATTDPFAVPAFSAWLPPNSSTSQWLSPYANWASSGGTFSYQLSFNLAGCDPSTVQVAGRWEADNQAQMFLNGTAVPGGVINNPGFNAFQNFTINGGFVAGLNTLEFRVVNLSSITGLRVEFTSATARCCNCVQPPAGMVAWWPLDEAAGATMVNDLSGAHHGTPLTGGSVGLNPPLGAPLPVAGAVAGGMHFVTNNVLVKVPHHPALNFGTGNFTLDAWVRTGQASPSINKVIVEKLDQTQKRGYSFSLQGNRLVLTLGDGGTVLQTFSSASAIAFGPWQHVAVTVDRAQPSQAVRFYLNAAADPPLALPSAFGNIDTTANLRIGGIETFIDEVELFNRALTAAELQAIYNAGAAGKCKPCVRPRVTVQPLSVKVCPTTSVSFTAAASGSPAPVVQWQVSTDGGATWNNIPNANGTTLVVAASALQNGVKYRAVFTNGCGVAYSSAATVTLINQPACAVFRLGKDFPTVGGSGSLSVVLPPGVPFTATSSDSWITVDATGSTALSNVVGFASQANQSGLVNYTVAPNISAAGRVGSLLIGGQSFAVVQGGANPVVSVSAARYGTLPTLSAAAIVAAFGTGLATSTQAASSLPLPTTLGGTQVKVRDAAGTERLAPLFFVSAGQINYLVPEDTANGPALVTVTAGDGRISSGTVGIEPVAPGVFTANASGRGVPAANALLVRPDGSSVALPVAQFDAAQNRFVPVPLDFGAAGNRLFLVLYGTGIRTRTDLAAVMARIGGIAAPVLFAAAQGDLAGLDQINLEVSRDLAGRGEVEVELSVDGQTTNTVTINIR